MGMTSVGCVCVYVCLSDRFQCVNLFIMVTCVCLGTLMQQ